MKDVTDALARYIANLSENAEAEGTYGVGGVLIDKNGKILVSMQNKVITDADPTAHVERQIVDWYFDQLAHGVKLPPASELTIISSLDPCMMCTGSILSAKFNVVSMAHDDAGGVDYDKTGRFKTLPSNLTQKALDTFGYFAVAERCTSVGPVPKVLAPNEITADLSDRALNAFVRSIPIVMGNRNKGLPPEQLKNPATIFGKPENIFLLKKIKQSIPSFLAAQGNAAGNLPAELSDILVAEAKAAEARGGRLNAAVLVDPFGNVLMAQGGDEQLSPIKTPIIQLVRNYARLRADLGEEGKPFLTDLKYCRVILLNGPGSETHDIADMGAFVSGGGAKLLYVIPTQSQATLDAMLNNFPPLYSNVVKLRSAQIEDKALIQQCEGALAVDISTRSGIKKRKSGPGL